MHTAQDIYKKVNAPSLDWAVEQALEEHTDQIQTQGAVPSFGRKWVKKELGCHWPTYFCKNHWFAAYCISVCGVGDTSSPAHIYNQKNLVLTVCSAPPPYQKILGMDWQKDVASNLTLWTRCCKYLSSLRDSGSRATCLWWHHRWRNCCIHGATGWYFPLVSAEFLLVIKVQARV